MFEDVSWEITNDNYVDLIIYGVVFSASVEFFNKTESVVSGTYWNDGLQELHEDIEVNILDEDSEFTINEVVECFQKIPHKNIEVIIQQEIEEE